ncbi:unnamed protein product [Umbelopsis vinacea]
MDYEKRQLQQSQEGEGFIAAIKAELFAPEKRQGNINIALSLTVFTGAIVFLRNFGDLWPSKLSNCKREPRKVNLIKRQIIAKLRLNSYLEML